MSASLGSYRLASVTLPVVYRRLIVSGFLTLSVGAACTTATVLSTAIPAGPEPSPTSAPATPGAGLADTAREEPSLESGKIPVSASSVFAELNPNGPKSVDPRQFRQLLPQDAIRPIYDPVIVGPGEANLDSADLVIGVSIAGESRAYPIRPLRFREMVNDRLGGAPILVTW